MTKTSVAIDWLMFWTRKDRSAREGGEREGGQKLSDGERGRDKEKHPSFTFVLLMVHENVSLFVASHIAKTQDTLDAGQ